MVSDGQLPTERVHVLSTGGMLEEARRTTAKRVLVATEIGMLHQLRQANPVTDFQPVNSRAACPYMKMSTPEKLLRALREGRDEVTVDPDDRRPRPGRRRGDGRHRHAVAGRGVTIRRATGPLPRRPGAAAARRPAGAARPTSSSSAAAPPG